MLLEDDAREQHLAERSRELERLITTGKVRAFGVAGEDGLARPLGDSDFIVELQLDVFNSRFAPRKHLALNSPAWRRARAASDAVGGVLVLVDDLRPFLRTSRRKATVAAERRAEVRLRAKLEAWVRAGAHMAEAPRKQDWLRGEGLDLAGSGAAAQRAWTAVLKPRPEFAQLRRQGRRPNKR